MTQTPAEAHAAAVRAHIDALPRWGRGDRQGAVAAIVAAGQGLAQARVLADLEGFREAAITDNRTIEDLIKQRDEAVRERKTAETELGLAEAAYQRVVDEAEDLRATIREMTAQHEAVVRLAGQKRHTLEQQIRDLAAENDRLREQLANPAIAAGIVKPGVTVVPAPGGDAPVAANRVRTARAARTPRAKSPGKAPEAQEAPGGAQ